MKYLIVYLVIMNIVGFCMMGADKRKAKKNQWRIPEATLLSVAAFGGSVGSYCGMRVFHHKTKHMKFRISLPLFIVLHMALGIYLLWLFH